MSQIPPLAHTVYMGGKAYKAGSVPPLEVAEQITSKAAWGGEVPDLTSTRDVPDSGGVPANSPVAHGLLGGDAALPAGANPGAGFEARPEGRPTDGGFGQAPAPLPTENPPLTDDPALADNPGLAGIPVRPGQDTPRPRTPRRTAAGPAKP